MPNENSVIRSFSVGSARVSVISIGDVTLPLAPAMQLQAAELQGDPDLRELADQVVIPLQSVLIETGQSVVLVDAGRYDIDGSSDYAVPGYTPPPSQIDSLSSLGIEPGDIQHVVITHRHWDHFNGTSLDGSTPTFPNARHYMSAVDWEAMQPALIQPGSRENRSIATVHKAGLVEIVDGDREIVPGVQILSAPGETPGHQIVRLEAGEPPEVLYALGDLYHHPAEFQQASWMVSWANPEMNARSRERLVPAAIRERAILVVSHIPSIGMLSGSVDKPHWKEIL